MHDEAVRLRYEAERCRRLINNVFSESTIKMLEEMAEQFEREADRLEQLDRPEA
jgi:hypothetical protein